MFFIVYKLYGRYRPLYRGFQFLKAAPSPYLKVSSNLLMIQIKFVDMSVIFTAPNFVCLTATGARVA
jgi:hypothetical protein